MADKESIQRDLARCVKLLLESVARAIPTMTDGHVNLEITKHAWRSPSAPRVMDYQAVLTVNLSCVVKPAEEAG